VELDVLVDELTSLTLDDIRALAIDLDAMVATPAEEIDITKAFLHIEASLRRVHRLRDAGHAARRASQAVVTAAERAGAQLPDAGVTRVARWAATVARGIVADVEAADAVALLSHGFDHVAPLALVSRGWPV
jgi:thioesterase domain-containing protein